MIEIEFMMMEATKRLKPENLPPDVRRNNYRQNPSSSRKLSKVGLQPGAWVVNPDPLGQHVASVGKVEESLLLFSSSRHPVILLLLTRYYLLPIFEYILLNR